MNENNMREAMEKILLIAEEFGGLVHKYIAPIATKALAAIAADRAARAESDWTVQHSEIAGQILMLLGYAVSPSLEPGADSRRDRIAESLSLYTAPPAAPVVPEEMSPANVPMYWRDESSNACAYAAGWNACRTTMLAAPAPALLNEEDKHCGSPDCVPCRDPEE